MSLTLEAEAEAKSNVLSQISQERLWHIHRLTEKQLVN